MHNIIGQTCKYQIRINEKLSLIPKKKKILNMYHRTKA